MLKKLFLFPLIFSLISVGITPITSTLNCQDKEKTEELRKPLIKNGWFGKKYYYSENDTHNHMSGAFSFLPKKIFRALISIKLITKIASYFGRQTKKEEPVKLKCSLPEPIQTKPAANSEKPVITWIGHASFLIQTNGFNILTDPVFGDAHAGPFPVSKRAMAPGVKLEDLPKIDAVVISHNHADHLVREDLEKIQAQNPNVQIYVPEGNRPLFTGKSLEGFLTGWRFKEKNIIEKTWWEEQKIEKNDQNLTLTFLPAKHWSIYINPLGYRKSLWGSWMISSGEKNIYFAGDTAYEDHFKQIGKKFKNIDVALLPIGPTHKDSDEHNPCHTNSKEAVQAFIDLNAKYFIPMHFATFFGRPNSYEYPVNSLIDTWKKRNTELSDKGLLLAQCGKTYDINGLKIATQSE